MGDSKDPKKRKLDKHFKIELIPVEKKEDDLPVKGARLLPELYGSSFFCAPTGAGKTTVIYNLLKRCTDRDTSVYIVCSTIDIDPGWIGIKDFLEKRGNRVFCFDSLMNEQKQNVLEPICQQMKQERLDQEEEKYKDAKPVFPFIKPFQQIVEEPKRRRKKKYRVPQNCIIIDDQNRAALRSPCVVDLVKKARHYRAKVFVSSQSTIHLMPDCWDNLWTVCLWHGISKRYIRAAFDRLRTDLTYEEFEALYDTVTHDSKRDFLTYYPLTNEFRHNFDLPVLDVKIFKEL